MNLISAIHTVNNEWDDKSGVGENRIRPSKSSVTKSSRIHYLDYKYFIHNILDNTRVS